MSAADVVEDLMLAQERCRKARREGRYFRAEWWGQMRDLALDHLGVKEVGLAFGCEQGRRRE